MSIELFKKDPRYKKLNAQEKQRAIGAYFDKYGMRNERVAALEERQIRKLRKNFIRDHAKASPAAVLGASVVKGISGVGRALSNTIGPSFQSLDPNTPINVLNKVAGTNIPEIPSVYTYLANKANETGNRFREVSQDVSLETGIAGQGAQLAGDIGGQVIGSLPAFAVGGAAGKALASGSTALRGAVQFGAGSALSADPGQRVVAGGGGATFGPLSAAAGRLSSPVLSRLIPGGIEGVGNVAEQAVQAKLEGQPVRMDLGQAIAAGVLGGVFGREAPNRLDIELGKEAKATQNDQARRVAIEGLERFDQQNLDIEADLVALRDLQDIDKKNADFKDLEYRVRSIPEKMKQLDQARRVARSGYENSNGPDVIVNVEDTDAAMTVVAQEEIRAASQENNGKPVTRDDGIIDPNAYRAQIRKSQEDINTQTIDQPNTPGDIDPRYDDMTGVLKFMNDIKPLPATLKPLEDARKRVINYTTNTVVEHFERVLDSDIARSIGKTARKSQDYTQAIRGELQDPLVKFFQSRRGLSTIFTDPLRKMERVELSNGLVVEESVLMKLLDGRAPEIEESLTDLQLDQLNKLRDVINKRGEIAEREGMLRSDQGRVVSFKNMPDKKIGPRVATDELIGILTLPDGNRVREAYISALAEMNGKPINEVRSIMAQLALPKTGEGSMKMFAEAQFDFKREFDRVPATMNVDGIKYNLFRVEPSAYAESLVNTGANTIGFRKAFGQQIGDQKPLSELKDAFIQSHNGQAAKLTQLFRVLNGMPIEDGAMNTISANPIFRTFNAAMTLFKAASLSGTAAINIPETIATALNAHSRAYFKSIKDLAINPAQSIAEVESMGLHFRDVFNIALDPSRKPESLARLLGETINRASLVKQANELNSIIIGRTALNAARMWQKGKGSPSHIWKLEALGYSQPMARRIIEGKASQQAYDDVARRLARSLPGGVLSNADKSLLENSKVFRSLSAFHTYAMATMRMNLRALNEIIPRINRVASDPSLTTKERLTEAASIMLDFARGTTTRAIAPTIAIGLTSIAMDGTEGANQYLNELETNTTDLILENMKYQMLVGPYGRASAALFSGDTESMAKSIYTLGVGLEISDALRGEGAYRNNLDGAERLATFIQRMTPAHKITANLLGMVGLSNTDQLMEAGMKAYYDFRRDEGLGGFSLISGNMKQADEIKNNREFTKRIAKAKSAIMIDADVVKAREEIVRAAIELDNGTQGVISMLEAFMGDDGDIGKAKELLIDAIINDPDRWLGNTDPIASSLRARKLLTKSRLMGDQATDGQYRNTLARLQNRLGEKAFARLTIHDAILDEWANSWASFSTHKISESLPELQQSLQGAAIDERALIGGASQ